MGLESVVHRIDQWGYPVWANRIAAASYVAMSAGTVAWVTTPHWSFENFAGFVIGLAGLGGVLATGFGRGTMRTYRHARDHIEREGRLDQRLMRRVIVDSQEGDDGCLGYCQQQGLYLAARDAGLGDAFERARREYSTILVPHF